MDRIEAIGAAIHQTELARQREEMRNARTDSLSSEVARLTEELESLRNRDPGADKFVIDSLTAEVGVLRSSNKLLSAEVSTLHNILQRVASKSQLSLDEPMYRLPEDICDSIRYVMGE